MDRRPILIDTDLSFDDYIAILYLLQHPQIEVRGITVVNGVVHVRQGVENARRLINLAGQPEIPVAGGPEQPLTGEHAVPALWRFILDYAPRLLLPGVAPVSTGHTAPELICRQCLDSKVPITVVALGPLTNLALALRSNPGLANHIDGIYISGGAFNVPGLINTDIPGNPNRVAEWNFYLDPEAANLVLQAGIPISLFPLDITHVTGPKPVLFSRTFMQQLRAETKGRISQVMTRIAQLWQIVSSQYPATPIWDTVTAVAVAEPAFVQDWREMALYTMVAPEGVSGQTVVEEGKSANARVCVGADQALFEKSYLQIASGKRS